MPIFRIGRAREATEFTAEKYKAAIRKYMESMGYAQTTDSSIEGHPADMIFLPQSNMPWQEVWVEAKGTKLSLSNQELANQVRNYLRQWLSRTPSTRFKFMIFAKHLSNLSRWETVWGNDLSPAEAVAWLIEGMDSISASSFTQDGVVKDVVSFFSETSVVVGTDLDLVDAAGEKQKVAMTANEIKQRAQRQLERMDERSRPVPKKSDIVSNLLQFKPPASFVVLAIEPTSIVDVIQRLKGRIYPPYRIVEKGNLVTFDTQEAEMDFVSLNSKRLRTLNLPELEKIYPEALPQLVNSAIRRFLRPLGVGTSDNWHYFLASKEAIEERNRVIRTPSGDSMQVARPLYLPEKEESFPSKRRLNFVFHQAFRARYRNLWGRHFIEFSLSKIYTKDGSTIIDGTKASRIDARFRNPAFDRSETRQKKRAKLAEYIFQSRQTTPSWCKLFEFDRFLRVHTDWTPDSVPIDQTMINEYEEETDDGID